MTNSNTPQTMSVLNYKETDLSTLSTSTLINICEKSYGEAREFPVEEWINPRNRSERVREIEAIGDAADRIVRERGCTPKRWMY